VRPVLEDALVDALRLAQVVAPVTRNARVEDLVMAALDHVDGVDLHVAEMLHSGARRLGPVAERRAFIKPLRAQPDATGARFGERDGFVGRAGHKRAGKDGTSKLLEWRISFSENRRPLFRDMRWRTATASASPAGAAP